jgi:hypothetical protein
MSRSTMANKSQLFGAATALIAVGILMTPAPAQAIPVVPLAPACTDYQFTGTVDLEQSNGWLVVFAATGRTVAGSASAFSHTSHISDMSGNVNGGINGGHLDFTIRWDNGPVGHYIGDVGDSGVATGTTVDQTNPGSTSTWHSTGGLACVASPTAPAPPPSAPPPPPASTPPPAPAWRPPIRPANTQATVTADVDVYDVPGGNGNVIGTLRKGQQVQLAGSCNKNDWCQVVDQGWVWGNLQF